MLHLSWYVHGSQCWFPSQHILCIINAQQLQARHGIQGEKNIVVTFH